MKPSPSENLLKQIREKKVLRAGMRVGVAVSGGADSVALLLLLFQLRAELGLVVAAVHFNHRLRGKASDSDEKFVAELAHKLGVALHVGHADVAAKAKREKANLEDAARRARYAFFARLAEQGIVDVVTTAHTMDDQAETVLAHILRGTGIAGLAGIHRMAGCVVRPLLAMRRAELREFLRQRKQKWREDASNRDTTRNRARMRKNLLPLLEKQFNSAVVEHLAALAERAREQASFVERLTQQVFERGVTFAGDSARVALRVVLDPLSLGAGESSATIQGWLLLKIIERVKAKPGQVLTAHLESIVRLAKSGEPGKRVQISGGVDVVKERDALMFRRR